LYSTVEDFFRWYQCWRDQKLIPAESWKAMTTPAKDNYGYGIFVAQQFDQKLFWHDGADPGFVSAMWWFPSSDIFVAAFANLEWAHSGEVADNLAALLLEKPLLSQPKAKTAVKLEAGQHEPFVGRYRMVEKPEMICSITASGGQLFLQSTGGPKLEMLAESETNFFLKAVPDVHVTFCKDASGNVTRLISVLAGHESEVHEGTRLKEGDAGAGN
jgi:hypothetical protein